MKKSLALLFVLALVTACGPKKEKRNLWIQAHHYWKKAEKKEVEKAAVNLENQGIGPIKSMNFEAEINQALADEGAGIFKQNVLLAIWLTANW